MVIINTGHEHPITLQETDEVTLAPESGDVLIRAFCPPCERVVSIATHVDALIPVPVTA